MKEMEEIYQEMKQAFSDRTSMTLADDGDLAVRLYAAAAQIYSLYLQSEWVARQCFPQTAAGEYLDRHAALRNIERRQAQRAEGTLRFSVDSAQSTDLTIPAGTVCMTAGLVRFETTEEAVLTAGTVSVDASARAVETGAGGNVGAGTVTSMAVAPVGVKSVTNPRAFAGGMEEEGDEILRARVLESFQRLPNGANAAFYEQGALSFDQVAAAKVLPKNRGLGTVDVVIATQTGMPNSTLLSQVEDYFERRREIAVDVKVLAPETQSVDVTVKVKAAEGEEDENVQERVEQTLTAWFTGERLGRDVLLAELGDVIFRTQGVANYSITLPAADVPISANKLPQLGTLTVEGLT